MASMSEEIHGRASHVQEKSTSLQPEGQPSDGRAIQEPDNINLPKQLSAEISNIDPEKLAQHTKRLSISHNDIGSSYNFPHQEPTAVQSSVHSTSFLEREIFDPTPRTPLSASPPSHSPSKQESPGCEDKAKRKQGPNDRTRAFRSQADMEVSHTQVSGHDTEKEGVPSPEIRNIMDQFPDESKDPDSGDTSPTSTKVTTHSLGEIMQHPPRQSSLEPLQTSAINHNHLSQQESSSTKLPSQVPTSPSRAHGDVGSVVSRNFSPTSSLPHTDFQNNEGPSSDPPFSGRPPSIQRAPLPEPDPEPDLPFDFHRFLEQLRHRSADPVAKFLRSFLIEFGKKQWMVHEQVKIISDFLTFIANKMAQCEIWQGVSEAEFDNAREGMEKLVMNRLYTQTFSPAIPPPSHLVGDGKGKQRHSERNSGPGRRGQHQEDVERDIVLAQKIRIYQWVREEHLDLQPVGDSGRKFLNLAQQGDLSPC